MNTKRRVTIVGCGALGSNLIPIIRNEDFRIQVIDFDAVEMQNTLSQFHPIKMVGSRKTDSIKATMQLLWKREIDVIPHKIRETNAEVLLCESDLVVDCLDNKESREVVIKECLKTSTPLLHGALGPNGESGIVSWSPTFKPHSSSSENKAIPTCLNGDFLSFIMFVVTHLGLSITSFMKTGKKLSFMIHPNGSFPL
jgi:hypothetical protein